MKAAKRIGRIQQAKGGDRCRNTKSQKEFLPAHIAKKLGCIQSI